MKGLKCIGEIAIIFLIASCNSTLMVRNPGRDILKEIKKNNITNDVKRYKRMQACEEKFLKRFNRLYAKQRKQIENTDVTTPFFSSNAN